MTLQKKFILMNLILCSAMHGLNHYMLIFYKPMYSVMIHYFNLNTIAEITTRMTIIYAGYGISNFFTGILAKRISLKLILGLGMLLMSLSTLCIYFVPSNSYSLVMLFVFLMGLGGGVYHPAANTLITASYEGKAGHAIGFLSIGSAIGFMIAPFIGEYIGVKLIGFQMLFLISGLVGILFSLIFLYLAKDHRFVDAKPVEKTNEPYLLFSKGKVMFIAIALLCIPVTIREIIGWGFYEITPFWVKYGFSSGITVSLVQSMQYLPGILVQPFTGKLCDKFGVTKVLLVTFSMLGLGLVLFSVSNVFVLWLAMILFGTGMSASTVSSETYMARLTTPDNRAMVYGIVLSIGLGFGGLMAGASGFIIDLFGKEVVTGYKIWYVLLGSLLMVSLSMYAIIEKLKKREVTQSIKISM